MSRAMSSEQARRLAQDEWRIGAFSNTSASLSANMSITTIADGSASVKTCAISGAV